MRITLTGRRLALLAVLVLGGVAAPLAYATISAKAPASTGATVAPVAAVSPTATRAPSAVADNPYQVTFRGTNTGGNCVIIPTPAGVDFVLEEATVLAPSATTLLVRANWKTAPGTFIGHELQVPVGSSGAGSRSFNIVVRPEDDVANAAMGDVFRVDLCFSGGTAGNSGYVILTGQRVTGAPTQAAVADFAARSQKAGTTLRWTTASETEILGFNVWRYRGTKGVKVNRTLIRAKRSGEPAGASYRYIDTVRGSKRALTYRLQLVDLKGKRTWYAAFAIASR